MAITAAVLIGAAACGGGDGDGAASGGEHGTGHPTGSPASPGAAQGAHNAQDVAFARMMIPHHRQAVRMSKVVLAGSGDARVRTLAGQIEKAQAPEIRTMTGWLKRWGAEAPPENGGDMPGMNHGGGDMPGMDHGSGPSQGTGSGGDMPGMMSGKEMAAFGELKGAELDRGFLTMMIAHHEGAVTMARQEQAKGAYGPAKSLADAIVRTQQAEIAQMRTLLKKR
ncbi:DUF305 domain-containing protein [Actinomadura sp. J1-007]|nr:DUF305 domain-containing protein [Actinomadura sp. J1-007]